MEYSEFKNILLEKGFTFYRNTPNFRYYDHMVKNIDIFIHDDFVEAHFNFDITQGNEYLIDGKKFHNAYDFLIKYNNVKIKWDISFGNRNTTLSRKSESQYKQILSIIDYALRSDKIREDIIKELNRLSKINSIDNNSSMAEIESYVMNRWKTQWVDLNDHISFNMIYHLEIYIKSDILSTDSREKELTSKFEKIFNTSCMARVGYAGGVQIWINIKKPEICVAYIKMFENPKLIDEFVQLINDTIEEFNEEYE